MESFRMFGAWHGAAIAAIAMLTALAVTLARRRGATASPTRAERAVGLAYLAAALTTYLYFMLSSMHEPAKTLPLQMCHLTAIAAALLLVTRWPPLRALVYFWGLALCTQALVTPSLTEGPALYPYWFFWTTHGLIFGVACYDLAARGYRPGWRDYGIACAGAAAYLAVVLPLDIAFGWNYGFVGPEKPEVRTIVDALGPWPQRVPIIAGIVAGAMALLLLPWKIVTQSKA